MRRTIVHWEPTGLRVPVPTHKPLLFGLLDAGVPVAYACMQGHCRTCRVTLTGGAVRGGPAGGARILRAPGAPSSAPHEPAEATVLLCTAYPASAHLSLALHP